MSNIPRSPSRQPFSQTATPSNNGLSLIGMRFTIVLLLMGIVPAVIVGWLALNQTSENIRSERIKTVGYVADAKHEQLVRVLTRANDRARSFLSNLDAQCNTVRLNQGCAKKLIESYLQSENALGLTLHLKGGENLSFGTPIISTVDTTKFKAGQLAKLSGTGSGNNTSYFIAVTEPHAGLKLEVTYPSTNFQTIFDRPAELGSSGETFLADGEGYFVTQARYPSTQGNDIPIHAHPMQTCLGGTNAEMLDMDYSDHHIIHGFRLVPELGSACIMAHIDQAEAFAPLKALQNKLIITISIFILLVILIAIYLARSIAQPIKQLAETRIVLEESEAKYRQLVETSFDGFWIVDSQGYLREANEAYARMSGYSVEELIKMHVSQLDEKDNPEEVAARAEKIIRQGHDRFETRHRSKDGRLIDVEIAITYLVEKNQFVVFSHDITARKLAEKVLQKSEDKLRAVLNATPFPIAIVDLQDNLIKFWSQSANTLFGHTASTAEEWYEIAYPDLDYRKEVVDQWKPSLEKAQSTGKTVNTGEYQVTCRDGSVRICELYATFIPDNLIVTFNDITERKQTELNKAFYKHVIETTNDGFWRFDTNGYLLEVNQSYARSVGYTINELIGKHISSISASTSVHEEVRARLDGIINKTTSTDFETMHRHKDGHLVYFQTTNTYLPEANCLFALLHDISRRKQAEAALRIAATAFETHEAIMITDANANIIRVNNAFQVITGFSAEDVFGKNPRILSSGRQDRQFYAAMWKQLLKTGSWTGEIWDKRKNGQIYPKWLTITAVKDNEGITTEYVAIFSDITARKKAEEEIYSLAYYDLLTELPNRRFLLDRLRQAQSIAARSKHYGALLFLDMDRFKILNDTLGHDIGDLFLIEIAKRLQNSVRDVDTVARIGGDEFVVLVEEIDLNPEEASQKVALIAEKIRSSLSKPYHLNEHEHHSSPSIGVCLYQGNDGALETILKQADMAMYQAKESGGNAVRFFDPAMQIAVETRASIEADLRQAVPEKHLRLYYQIQLDSENKPIGAEALIRWIHPDRGLVSPMQFIPIAEESALILEIGHWVLETACKQLATWGKKELTSNLILAVNVSAQQFKRHDFVEMITTQINIHNINPNLLKLELTEGVVLSDVNDVISKMHLLKALGVRLSLDDFGTGYSSLSYLKQLPLDQIKIDQGFVRDMTVDPNDAVMVQTIINLANSFRMNVIAEGVETEAQLKFLKDNGCMAYQGYLFSKPVPIEEFEALLNWDKS